MIIFPDHPVDESTAIANVKAAIEHTNSQPIQSFDDWHLEQCKHMLERNPDYVATIEQIINGD